jgi:hypothetical protein
MVAAVRGRAGCRPPGRRLRRNHRWRGGGMDAQRELPVSCSLSPGTWESWMTISVNEIASWRIRLTSMRAVVFTPQFRQVAGAGDVVRSGDAAVCPQALSLAGPGGLAWAGGFPGRLHDQCGCRVGPLQDGQEGVGDGGVGRAEDAADVRPAGLVPPSGCGSQSMAPQSAHGSAVPGGDGGGGAWDAVVALPSAGPLQRPARTWASRAPASDRVLADDGGNGGRAGAPGQDVDPAGVAVFGRAGQPAGPGQAGQPGPGQGAGHRQSQVEGHKHPASHPPTPGPGRDIGPTPDKTSISAARG